MDFPPAMLDDQTGKHEVIQVTFVRHVVPGSIFGATSASGNLFGGRRRQGWSGLNSLCWIWGGSTMRLPQWLDGLVHGKSNENGWWLGVPPFQEASIRTYRGYISTDGVYKYGCPNLEPQLQLRVWSLGYLLRWLTWLIKMNGSSQQTLRAPVSEIIWWTETRLGAMVVSIFPIF